MYLQMSNGDVTASFSLVDDDETRKMWNHRYVESVKYVSVIYRLYISCEN